jgi:hypothetical protein
MKDCAYTDVGTLGPKPPSDPLPWPRAGFVLRLAIMKRMRPSRKETNPTTAQSHDGQCQGVTPFFFLKLSDDE